MGALKQSSSFPLDRARGEKKRRKGGWGGGEEEEEETQRLRAKTKNQPELLGHLTVGGREVPGPMDPPFAICTRETLGMASDKGKAAVTLAGSGLCIYSLSNNWLVWILPEAGPRIII